MKKASVLLIVVVLLASFSFLGAEEVMLQEDKARLGLAQSLNNLKKYREAEKILLYLYAKFPENETILTELVRALGYGGKLSRAQNLLKELEKKHQGDKKLKYLYANMLEANNNFQDARAAYADLLAKHPADQDLELKVADTSTWLKDYDSAIKYYRAVLTKNPDDIPLKIRLADVCFWSKDYASAVHLYEQVNIDPALDRERYKNLGDAYLGIKRFNQALDIYRKLLSLYPQTQVLRLDIANVYLTAGDFDKTEKEIKRLLEENPEDKKILFKLADIYSGQNKFNAAIKVYEDILARDPLDKEAGLYLGRTLGWAKRYNAALEVYEKIIRQNPHWTTPRREKARMLGWMHKYDASIEEYRRLIKETGPEQAVSLEMEAKNNFYRGFDIRAINAYKKWLELEPDDTEALFDLAQAYSRQKQWRNAKVTYNKILWVSPGNFAAKSALDKVRLCAKANLLESGFEIFEADSSSRDTDKKYAGVFTSIQLPLNESINLKAKEEFLCYYFSQPSAVNREKSSLALEYHQMPFFRANLNYAFSHYSDGLDDTQNFSSEFNLKPIDRLALGFYQQRSDVIENADTLKTKLRRDDYKFRGSIDLTRLVYLGVDYLYSYFSDENKRKSYGVDTSYKLLSGPRNLNFYYRYETYGFDHASGIYFSPDNFHTQKAGLEWRHFLNKELFWGADDIYYTLKYALIFDVRQQRGHALGADFHRDWNKRFSTHLEWSKTIYEHQEIYGEDKVLFYTRYYF